MSANDKRALILSDEPADKDEFGSHQRVADAISKLIKDQDGDKAICILGCRGSGKSTAVKLLFKKLKDSINHYLFIFDAWSHQGDPLKKSFLEEFMRFLLDNNLIDIPTFRECSKELSERSEETTKTTKPILTKKGTIVATLAYFLPLGLLIFGYSLNLSAIPNIGISPLFIGLFGFFIFCLPLIVAYYCTRKDRKNKENITCLFSGLFKTKTAEIEKSRTIRLPDPTSIEFKKCFYKIVGESLNDNDNRLIIIVDNLDRLDSSDALNLWSTLRIFFDHSDIVPKWMSRFWLVVPIDENSVKHIWYKDYLKEDKTILPGEGYSVKAFIDKTFQIIFRISQPVMSDWEDYFKGLMGKAFPDHDPDEYEIIFRLFSVLKKNISKNVTPREIKLFINNLVALYLQWRDEIPLSIQSLFLLCKDNIDDPYTKIPDLMLLLNFISENEDEISKIKLRITKILDIKDIDKYLSALYFNVDIEKASQVLLQKPIDDYLIKDKTEELKNYYNVSGFNKVLISYIERNAPKWLIDMPYVIANAALCINEIEINRNFKLTQAWEFLIRYVKDIDLFNIINENIALGLLLIINNTKNYEKENIITALIKAMQYYPETEDKDEDEKQRLIEDWLSGTIKFIRDLKEMNYSELLKKHYFAPGNHINYIDIMAKLTDNNEYLRYACYFKPNEDQKDKLIQYLLGECNENRFSSEIGKSTELILSNFKDEFKWPPLIDSITKRLLSNANPIPSLDEVKGCLIALIALNHYSNTNAGKMLVSDGHIASLLGRQDIQGRPFIVAMCVFLHFYYLPEANITKEQPNSQNGIQNYKQFCTNPESKANILDKFIFLCKSYLPRKEYIIRLQITPINNLTIALIYGLINLNVRMKELFTVNEVVNNYIIFENKLPSDLNSKLLSEHLETKDIIDEITNKGFLIENSELYFDIYEHKNHRKNSKYVTFLIDGMKMLGEDTWLQEFLSAGHFVKLLFKMLNKGISVKPDNITTALKNYAQELIAGIEIADTELYKENWHKLLGLLEDDDYNKLMSNIIKIMSDNKEKTAVTIIDLYGEDLAVANHRRDDVEDIIGRIMTNMIIRRIITEIVWVNNALKNKTIWVTTKTYKDVRDRFIIDVNGALSKEDDERIKEALSEIVRTIEPRKKKQARK